MVKLAKEIYRDWNTDGVPKSGAHKPIKPDIREWGASLEQRSVTPQMFGAKGDGVADDAPAFNAVLEYGGPIVVPAGIYRFATSIATNLTRDVSIVFAAAAWVVLDAGITDAALYIWGAERMWSLDVTGGAYDASAVANPDLTMNFGTVWSLNKLRRFSVQNGNYKGGGTFLAATGDTAIAPVICGAGLISGNRFVGWPDNAIYATGGNLADDPSDDGGPLTISGNSFEYCLNGIALKRRNRNVMVVGNHFRYCHNGIVMAEVGSGEIQPGEQAAITGNTFFHLVNTAVLARGHGYFQFTGNHVTDWGYDLAGVAAGIRPALLMHGCRDCTVTGNTFALRELTPVVGIQGISIINNVIDDETYIAGNNFVGGNIFLNLEQAVVEGGGVNANYFINNVTANMLTAEGYTLTNPGSIYIGARATGDYRILAETINISGGHIRFPPVARPSTDATTIDDYEEGVWTPVAVGASVAGDGTYSSQGGTYTKIGRMVYIEGQCGWSAHTGTGAILINGLPFTNVSTIPPILNLNASLLTFTGQVILRINTGSTQIQPLLLVSNTASGNVAMDTACTFTFSGSYITT